MKASWLLSALCGLLSLVAIAPLSSRPATAGGQRKPQKASEKKPAASRPSKKKPFRREQVVNTRVPNTGLLNCSHFGTCAGCVVAEGFGETPIVLKARARLEPLLGGASLPIHVGPHHGWRTQARLAAAPASAGSLAKGRRRSWRSGVELGLYRAGSHEVVPIANGCRVHAPEIERAALALERACAATGVRGCFADKGFDDDAPLRYAQLASCASDRVALTLVWNARTPKDAAPALGRLVKEVWDPEVFASVWVNYRVGEGNAIFNLDVDRWEKLKGAALTREKPFLPNARLVDAELELRFTPLVFRQANLAGFSTLVESLAKWVPRSSVVCELYAGVGAIGLAIRPLCAKLRCSEINPNAAACFEAAAAEQEDRLGPNLAPARFRAADAADAIKLDAKGADVIVVDPPRKGLEPEVLEALVGPVCADAKRLIYVSCGFDALERELESLLKSQWVLTHAEGHCLFPGSDHVETLAIFDRPLNYIPKEAGK